MIDPEIYTYVSIIKMNACNIPNANRKKNPGSGAIQGTNINNTIKNISSPLIEPKSLNDKDTILEICEITSIGNINGARAGTGPIICPKYLPAPFSLKPK
jgi:hypothetical protein